MKRFGGETLWYIPCVVIWPKSCNFKLNKSKHCLKPAWISVKQSKALKENLKKVIYERSWVQIWPTINGPVLFFEIEYFLLTMVDCPTSCYTKPTNSLQVDMLSDNAKLTSPPTGQTLILTVKLLHSVFSLLLGTRSFCFGGETSVHNSSLKEILVNNEHWMKSHI